MIYAWRYPKQHPPLGDDRRQPTRQVPLGREDDRRADPPLRRAVLRGTRLPHADARPRGRAARGVRPTSPITSGSCRSRRATSRLPSFFGLNNTTTDGAGPIPAAKTIGTLLSAGNGDASGVLVPLAAGANRVSRVRRSGESTPPSTGRTDAAAARGFFAAHADRGSIIGAPRNDFVWVGGRLVECLACESGREPVHARPQLQGRDAPDRRRARLRDAAAERDASELLPHLPNGRQVVLRGFGHTDDFWAYAAEGEQPTRQHVLRQRPCRHVAVHAEHDRRSRRGRRTARSAKSLARRGRPSPSLDRALASVAAVAACTSAARFGRKSSAAVRSLYVVVARAGRLVCRRAHRAGDDAEPAARRRPARRALGRRADRARHLLRLGEPRLVHPHEGDGASQRRSQARSSAHGSGFHVLEGLFALVTTIVGATVGANLHAPRVGHRVGSAGSRSLRIDARQGCLGGASLDRLKAPERSIRQVLRAVRSAGLGVSSTPQMPQTGDARIVLGVHAPTLTAATAEGTKTNDFDD